MLPSAFDLPRGRLLALDLGQVRHGVAICDEAGILATPLAVVRRQSTRAQDFAAVGTLVERERAVGVLVGLPEAYSAPGEEGSSSPQSRWVRRYAGRLAGSLPVPVAFWDESLSSKDAEHLLALNRTAGSGGSTPSDAVAAALILGDFLEARRRTANRHQAGDR